MADKDGGKGTRIFDIGFGVLHFLTKTNNSIDNLERTLQHTAAFLSRARHGLFFPLFFVAYWKYKEKI